jgi:hypothetical protein
VTSQSIGLRGMQTFLSGPLPMKIAKDLRALRIIKEADLECCAFYHLRQFLQKDPTWNVFARKHVPHTDHYVDLILFRRGYPLRREYPRIAIELKWNLDRISPKDRHSLNGSIRSLGVHKAYFMTTLVGAKVFNPIRKTRFEKNRLFEIVIRLPLTGHELDDWKQRRRAFMSNMVRGKARKKVTA